MTAPTARRKYRVRLTLGAVPGEDGTRVYEADVYDPQLFDNRGAYNAGDDYVPLYGPTPLAAIQRAVTWVHDGEADRHFAPLRAEYGR